MKDLADIRGPAASTIRSQGEVGDVLIVTDPPGAEIYINAESYGKTPRTIPNLKIGPQTLDLALEDHVKLTKKILVRAGQTTKVEELLSKQQGGFIIESIPSNATCTLKGKRLGRTPCKVPAIDVGYPGSNSSVRITRQSA